LHANNVTIDTNTRCSVTYNKYRPRHWCL